MSYKSRRFGPSIDEKDRFYNHKIVASNPSPWPEHVFYQQGALSNETEKKLEKLKSSALVIIKDGTLIFEKYWEPFHSKYPTNSFSVAKSIVAILIGAALREGKIKNIHDPVYNYLPEFKQEEKKRITLFHLLTMTTGLYWVESENNALSDNARAYYGKDLSGLIRSLKVKTKPGTTFAYTSGSTQILAEVFAAATGLTVGQYANNVLWPTLQAEENAYWNLDRQNGVEKAFCCFYATPKDFARIGQLFLNGGTWNETIILDREFVDQCLTPTPVFDPLAGQINNHYGLHWWLCNYKQQDYFYARGIRGQYIICNPKQKLIIVRTGRKRNPVEYPNRHPPDLFDHIDAGMEILQSIPQ